MQILISIYPKYCELIKKKKKNYEFRSFSLNSEKEMVFWIYETKPIKQIKYKMLVANPIKKASKNYPYFLGEEQFLEAIKKRKNAYQILGFEELEVPITLDEMISEYSIKAPQNFIYLDGKLDLLKRLNEKSTKIIF